MKITQVEIENIRGIEKLSFAPNTLTVISGANGTGKTSLIEALKAMMSGGHDPTLLRKGAERGKVVVVFDDAQSLTLNVTPIKSERIVKDSKGRKVSAPMSIINEMTSAITFDPLSFLEAKEDEQLKLLLESMPIKITPKDLNGIPPVSGIDLSQHGLVVLKQLHDHFYNERRDLSREAKSKQATIEQLQSGLPESNDQAEQLLADATLALDDLIKAKQRRQKRNALIYGDKQNSARAAFVKEKGRIESEIEIQIQALRETARIEIESALTSRDASIASFESEYNAASAAIDQECNQNIDSQRERVGVLKGEAQAAQRAEGQRQAIAKMQIESDGLITEIAVLNESLASVERLKTKLTTDLPISGLEITDGKLLIDGIPLSAINTADRILEVALQVALLRMKQLPFLVIDNGERLDSAHLETLERIAKEKGLQVILSRVSDDSELQINA